MLVSLDFGVLLIESTESDLMPLGPLYCSLFWLETILEILEDLRFYRLRPLLSPISYLILKSSKKSICS